MAEETTQETQDLTNTPRVGEGADAPVETASAVDEQTAAEPATTNESPPEAAVAVASEDTQEQHTDSASSESDTLEPDALQPFIDKAGETIQHEVESEELNKFLRAHIKTFREEWDTWEDSARDAYVHMMTSQLLQRKAAKTRIMNYEAFKLPVPSAQTKLFESIKQSQVKPQKRRPVLLLPPNLRPAYVIKK
jgi:hypothetical protein